MDKPELSRRKLLAGIATAGGTGAVVGTGTTALFSDRETFTNNSLEASKSITGVVDMEVTISALDSGGVKYSTTLPGDVNNNPSYIWVRTSMCPKPADPADDLRVELRLKCDGNTETILVGSLREVLDALRDGELLACDESDPCLQVGGQFDLELDVIDVLDDDLSGDIKFDLEFYGEQCRYNTGTENPFDTVIDSCTPTGKKGISYIAFCSESGNTLDPTIVEWLAEDSGQPTSLIWETDADVDYVVVKSGNYFTLYDYSDPQVTSGVATTGDDTDAEIYDIYQQNYSSNPCELADKKFDDSSFNGTSIKLEHGEINKVTINDTNSPVDEGDILEVTTTVENTSTEDGAFDAIELDVGGTVRDSKLVDLDAGASKQITLEWATESGDAGTYKATVSGQKASATESGLEVQQP